MSSTKRLAGVRRVNMYVDGFNLYHALDQQAEPPLKWLNLRELARTFLAPGEALNRVVYFTAVLTWDHEKQRRHRTYIAAQRAVGVDVVESIFKKVTKHCRTAARNCSRYEEKQTDVALAVAMLSDAMRNDYDRAILITADSDQIPLLKELRASFPEKPITLAAPPGRAKDARELGAIAADRKPLTVERLRACPLPRDVRDADGKSVASMPAAYARR